MTKTTPRSPCLFPWLLLGCLMCLPAAGQVPPHLDIVSASIEELPPIDRENVPGRTILLKLEVGGPPACDGTTGFLAYGFMVDADSDAATGASRPAFDDLGVDARLSAICDPASGLFTSPLGPVSLTPGAGTTTIEILSTVSLLPSLEFRWIAFAQQDSLFSRLPQMPDHAAWATHEKEWF